MKGCLIVLKDPEPGPTDAVSFCPTGCPIPDGWEEVELEYPPISRGTRLVGATPEDLCRCTHSRLDHARHGGECLEHCDCQRFRDAA